MKDNFKSYNVIFRSNNGIEKDYIISIKDNRNDTNSTSVKRSDGWLYRFLTASSPILVIWGSRFVIYLYGLIGIVAALVSPPTTGPSLIQTCCGYLSFFAVLIFMVYRILKVIPAFFFRPSSKPYTPYLNSIFYILGYYILFLVIDCVHLRSNFDFLNSSFNASTIIGLSTIFLDYIESERMSQHN